jgi:hypothetical protein
MKLTYQVVAGKYDGHDRNTKYVWGFNTLEEAFDDVANKNLYTYPFCEIEVHGVGPDHKFIIDCTNPVYVKRLKG